MDSLKFIERFSAGAFDLDNYVIDKDLNISQKTRLQKLIVWFSKLVHGKNSKYDRDAVANAIEKAKEVWNKTIHTPAEIKSLAVRIIAFQKSESVSKAQEIFEEQYRDIKFPSLPEFRPYLKLTPEEKLFLNELFKEKFKKSDFDPNVPETYNKAIERLLEELATYDDIIEKFAHLNAQSVDEFIAQLPNFSIKEKKYLNEMMKTMDIDFYLKRTPAFIAKLFDQVLRVVEPLSQTDKTAASIRDKLTPKKGILRDKLTVPTVPKKVKKVTFSEEIKEKEIPKDEK